MKYLVSTIPAKAGIDPKEWAPPGEPVVPWFPATLNNAFLSVTSFKPVLIAEVQDIDADPDELHAKLVKEYPGLPSKLHENYVLAIAMAASKHPVGTKFKVLVDYDSASLQQVGMNEIYPLWTEQPMK